ncbi:50S ribosomal protein L18 [Chloroflexota bacterium]
MAKLAPREARKKRHYRVRMRVTGRSDRPRLCVYRSLNHIYAQVIDDVAGRTLVAASTGDPGIKEGVAGKNKTDRAKLVGTELAKKAVEQGIKKVAFDRGGYLYHGRVKALAEAARESGLEF